MVHLTNIQQGVLKTFGLRTKFKLKMHNHRKELRHQRFQDNIDTEEIVNKYSNQLMEQTNPLGRTFKDAQQTVGRKNYLLPNLSAQDLEANELFEKELNRQRTTIARVEKIKIHIDSVPGRGTNLMMNKNISTPYDCARHLHDLLTTRTVVAEILPYEVPAVETPATDSAQEAPSEENDQVKVSLQKPRSVYWDMHRPLKDDCTIKFRHFAEENVGELNKIYWRSCSFVLGMTLRLAFKDNISVLPHSWPKPNIKSGSFVYDVALSLGSRWEPQEQELRAFTKLMWDIKNAALPFDRLEVNETTAKSFFFKNPFKQSQIESIARDSGSEGQVTVYRCGGLLDISIGPMISNTNQIGRITLAAVHPFDTSLEQYKGVFYRFQGISLPQQLPINSYLYQNILINQAKKLNKTSLL